MERLIIRVDASTEMGTGHFMRCLSLAQAWKDVYGSIDFITACQSKALLQQLREEGIDIHLLTSPYLDPNDWDSAKDILAYYPNTWVVLDGYHFDEVYQQRVKNDGYRLLVIDDMAHLKHYYADIVLNQNLHAEQLHYSCEPDTRLLLGTKYVLLRREFLASKNWKHEIPEVAKRVLVTLGGSDAKNHTSDAIKALQKVGNTGLEATVVIGASNPHSDKLEVATKESCTPIRIIRNASNMPELMALADVAICSAGTTIWELAFMGIPTIAMATTPTEEFLIEGLDKNGLFTNLNCVNGFSENQLVDALNKLVTNRETRLNMSQMGRKFVDGGGCGRVVKHILR